MYVFSEASTRHAISRSSYREFQKGDIVQLNLSSKIDGYCAAIGSPICLGKLEGQRKDIVQSHRVRCLRTNEEKDFGDFTAKFDEQYAIMLESDVPVVAQYGRADPRTVAFYTTPGYCE